MWKPFFGALIILAISCAGAYELYSHKNEIILAIRDLWVGGNIFVGTVSVLLLIAFFVGSMLGIVGGLGGAIMFPAIKLDNEGYFEAKSNWYGKFFGHIRGKNFCQTGLECGFNVLVLLLGLGIIGVVVAFVLYSAYVEISDGIRMTAETISAFKGMFFLLGGVASFFVVAFGIVRIMRKLFAPIASAKWYRQFCPIRKSSEVTD